MSGSDTAFNRIKSLLGKMDRSIDDARQHRLHADEDQSGPPIEHEHDTDLSNSEQKLVPQPAPATAPAPVASRPPSKYGKARPIRELRNTNGHAPDSDKGSTGFSHPKSHDADTGWKTA